MCTSPTQEMSDVEAFYIPPDFREPLEDDDHYISDAFPSEEVARR
jgi:hypothetical protein